MLNEEGLYRGGMWYGVHSAIVGYAQYPMYNYTYHASASPNFDNTGEPLPGDPIIMSEPKMEIMDNTCEYVLGQNNVADILYHPPTGPGDGHIIDIIFENGQELRFFDIKRIGYNKGGE